MRTYESACNGCPECRSCRKKHKKYVIISCDLCGSESKIYDFNFRELCIDCIMDKYSEPGICIEC